MVGMCCVEGSLTRSEWGMRGAPVHLHPSRPDGSPPSTVRRHHKTESADEHSDSNMSSYILSLVRSEWGMRGAPVHLHPCRPDGSPPSTVRRHHKHENADEHSDNNMSSHIMSLMRSEWGMRGAPVHLHPSHQDGSPPSAVRRHHKPENTDEHSASSMSPYILPAVCLTSRSSDTRTCREQESSTGILREIVSLRFVQELAREFIPKCVVHFFLFLPKGF